MWRQIFKVGSTTLQINSLIQIHGQIRGGGMQLDSLPLDAKKRDKLWEAFAFL